MVFLIKIFNMETTKPSIGRNMEKKITKILTLSFLSSLIAFSPLEASDGSLFLGTVGPLQSVDGLPPFTGANDEDALIYQSYKASTIDPFLSTYINPVSEVFEPPPGTLVENIPIPQWWQARMYFVSEEAGFSNQLGFIDNGNFDLTHPDNANNLIFDRLDSLADPSGPPNDVVKENDYVEIYSSVPTARTLDFFLITDGADALPADTVVEKRFYTDESLNEDLEEHFLIVELPSVGLYRYYLIAAEDLVITPDSNDETSSDPGDYPVDFADAFVVLQVTTPEPQTYLVLGSFLAAVAWKRSKEKALV